MGQSWDAYSDMGLAYQLATGTYTPVRGYQAVKHPIYAAAMMVPVALAFLFTVNQWAKNESGWKKKLITLPFLLLQLYPPFAALRLVVYLITRNRKWFDANRIYNQSV